MSLPEHLQYLSHLPENVLKTIDGSGQLSQSIERQDLEKDVKRLNILETPFFERLEKVQATAYEHEYVLVTSRHDKIGYANYKDGGIPRVVEVDAVKRRVTPSLIGHRISITELAKATTAHGVKTAEQVAREEKIVAVMEETEYQLFYGDRNFGTTDYMSPQNLQFDGIENIIKRGAPQNVLDNKGMPLTIASLWAAENRVYMTQGNARPNVAMISPLDKINLQTQYYQLARINAADRAAGLLGATASSYTSAYGEAELVTSRFLGDWHKFSDQAFGMAGQEYARPAKPTMAATPVVKSQVANGEDGLVAGTRSYAIKAANFNGESEAEFIENVTLDGTTENQVEFKFSVIDPSTKWLLIFVDEHNGKGFKFLKRVAVHSVSNVVAKDDGHERLVGAYGTYRYRKVPGTGIVPIVDFSVTSLAQWIPLEQVPLPQYMNTDYAIRHVSSLYSRAPEFSALIVNVEQESLL